MPLQIRRGPTSDRLAITPLAGELVYDTTTGSVYVGNGSTAGGLPVTNFSVGDARTATAKMFLGESLADNSVHSGISYAYVGDRLQSTVAVNLSNYIGLIKADQGFKGNLWADDSGLLVNSETGYHYGTFQGGLIATGDILPNSNEVHDIGSNSLRFKDLYLSGSSLHLGNAVITSTGTAIDLPLGTTVAGQPIGLNEGDIFSIDIMGRVLGSDSTVMINPYTGEFRGNLKGSVFGDDSTILVDGTNGVLRGTLIGELQGNVVGNLTGTASTATVANTVAIVATDTSASTHYITFVDTATGNENVRTDTGLTYVPNTNTLSATFSGNLTGNVTGNVTGDVSGNAGTASLAQVSNKGALVASNSAGGSHYVLFSQNATGDESFRTDTAFYYNPLNNVLYADYFNGAFAGNLTGNVTGSVTGTIYTTLISSATAGDSTTGLTVTPPTTFEADVLMNSDLVVNNVVPETSEAYSLGSFTKKFDRLYLKEGTNVLWLGNVAMSVSGSILDLPVGATVGGVPIPSSIGSNASTVTITSSGTNATFYLPFVDNITGNLGLYADNGLSYNPSTNTITATTFVGNLQGNVTGNVTGQVFGSAGSTVAGTLTGNVVSSSSALTVVNTSAATAVFTGNLSGNVTGNVNGNVNGNVTGDITGVIYGNAGSVITGTFTGPTTGTHTGPVFGDLKGSVFADDSTVMVNAIDQTFFGSLTGNVSGNVTGNVSGNVTGNVISQNTLLSVLDTSNSVATFTGTVTGNIRTNSITSADSSQIVVNPQVSFDSNIVVEGSITARDDVIFEVDRSDSRILSLAQAHNDTVVAPFILRRSKGTLLSPTSVVSGDQLGSINWTGFNGTSYLSAAAILASATGTVNSTKVPGKVEIFTTGNTNGLLTRAAQFSVTDGNVFSAPSTFSTDTYSSSSQLVFSQHHSTSADARNISYLRSRGSEASPSTVINGDDIAEIVFQGHDGTTYRAGMVWTIAVDGAVSSPTVPMSLVISTDTGSGFQTRITLASSGNLTSTQGIYSNGTAGIGYSTGAGGTVTQLTGKTTGVTLNKITGEITMESSDTIGGDALINFTLTNSTIASTDHVVVTHISGGTLGSYYVFGVAGSGSATIYVRNLTGGSLSEGLVLKYTVIKAVNS